MEMQPEVLLQADYIQDNAFYMELATQMNMTKNMAYYKMYMDV